MKRVIYILMALLGFSLSGCDFDTTVDKHSDDTPTNDNQADGDSQTGDDDGKNDDNNDNNNDDNIHDMPVAYGTPHVYFTAKARVVDSLGNPIPGIEMQAVARDEVGFEDGNNYSDTEGNIETVSIKWWLTDETSWWARNSHAFVFTDLDGVENGGDFETIEVDVTDLIIQTGEGDDNWYMGSYEADLGDVELSLKQSEESTDEDNTSGEE